MTRHEEFFAVINEFGPNIERLYREHAEKRPVMQVSLPAGRIYAYPYTEFLKTLTPRSQRLLKKEYAEALKTDSMVVFVRDEDAETLRSASFPIEPPEEPQDERSEPERPARRKRRSASTGGRAQSGRSE